MIAKAYLPRFLGSLIETSLSSFPIVVISGARQTGKSTLARQLEPADQRRYLTLDDFEVFAMAREEPDALLRSADRLTLDEVQRFPDLLLAIKRAVDEDRVPGRFLLTGSANFLLLKHISETLAGRAIYLTLWPLTRREQLGLGRAGSWTELIDNPPSSWPDMLREAATEPGLGHRTSWQEWVRHGGYPIPALSDFTQQSLALWFSGYTQTYLERDLRELSEVGSLVDFRRLMRAACLRLGSLVNQTKMSREIGLSQSTVHRHLDLLEASYQLVRLPAYAVNRGKRLIKTPKLYWCDPGLALHLAGKTEPGGAHLENLILSDLLAWQQSHPGGPEILYWRTTAGHEVDLIVEWGDRLLPIEVKAAKRASVHDAKNLKVFRAEYPDLAHGGLVLYDGDEIRWLADQILAVPWWRVI